MSRQGSHPQISPAGYYLVYLAGIVKVAVDEYKCIDMRRVASRMKAGSLWDVFTL